MRWAAALVVLAWGCRDAAPPAPPAAAYRGGPSADAPVVWRTTWTSPITGDLLPGEAGVVLIRRAGERGPVTIALDEDTGAERWRLDGRIERGLTDAVRYYVVEHRLDVLDVREIELATGAPRQGFRLDVAASARALLAERTILVLGGGRMQAFSLDHGTPLWSQPTAAEASRYAGSWNGWAVFVDPYLAVELGTGRAAWSMPGCCVAANLGGGRSAVQLGTDVGIVGADGALHARHAGTIRSIGEMPPAVVCDARGKTYALYGIGDGPVELTPFAAAPATSAAVAGQRVYFYTPAGALRELHVDRHDSAAVPIEVSAEEAAIAPVVTGDERVYVPRNGWVALDRSPSRSERGFDVH